MLRRITPVTLILIAACNGGPSLRLGSSKALSYAQYHSLQKGLTAKSVLTAFGKPADALEKDGKVRGLTYPCENSAGKVVALRLVFDDAERLAEWALSSAEAS